jgi:replication-associated recombination protein RarA
MNKSMISKYKPYLLDEINIPDFTKKLINIYINNNNINFLIVGNAGSGKTSLINIILNIYYKTPKNISKNIIYINLLKEQGINYYRNELKNFCQISNLDNKIKKTIILDDLDLLNEQIQLIINNYINNYKHINFIISCSDQQKIKENLLYKLELIKINSINEDNLDNLLNKIIVNENIELNDICKKYIIKSSNFYYTNLLNIIEKIILLDIKILNPEIINNLICNILVDDFIKYIDLCNKQLFKPAIELIISIYDNGYSVIDILDELCTFIKTYDYVIDIHKYKIIKLICKYIYIFNNVHEDSIELIFLTNNLIYILNSN